MTPPGDVAPGVSPSVRIRFSSIGGDAEMSAASTALENLLVERWVARFADWQRVRSSYPENWQAAAIASEFLVHLTPEELAELHTELLQLFNRFEARNADASLRPEGSSFVEIVVFGHPIEP